MASLSLVLPPLVRCLSLPRLLKMLDRKGRRSQNPPPEHFIRLLDGLLALQIGPLKPGCFVRSVILFHILRRRSFPVVIIFGISEIEEELAGHAWLELEGQALGEEGDPREAFGISYCYPQQECGSSGKAGRE